MERCGKMWKDMERCGKIWKDVERYGERSKAAKKNEKNCGHVMHLDD